MINFQNIKNITLKFFVVLFFVFLSSYSFANEYKEIILKNGLRAYIIKTKSPIVTHAIAYNVGSVDEVSSKEGIAHFLEHTMFLGTNRYSKKDFSKMIKEIGANYNAFTSSDMTLYYISLPTRHLHRAMEFEADRMRWLLLDEKDVENEKQVVNEERKMYENNVYGVFYELFNRYAFPTTNYGRNIMGWYDNFNKITTKDLRNFYEQWYAPNNAVLFIMGNVDFKNTEKMINKYYASRSSSKHAYERGSYNEQIYSNKIQLEFKDSRLEQDLLTISFLVPSFASDVSSEKKDAYSAMIMTSILGSNSGKLYKKLVLEKKLAVGIFVDYDSGRKGHTLFSFRILPTGTVSNEIVLQEFHALLTEILKESISIKEINHSVKIMKDNSEFLRQQEEDYVFMLAGYVNSGLSFQEAYGLLDSLSSIKVEDVNSFNKKYLIDNNYIVGKASKR